MNATLRIHSVYDRLGKTVTRGAGLRPVLRHASKSPVNVISCKPNSSGGYYVEFWFDDGARCGTQWSDWRVLLDWLHRRRSWSVGRFTFDRTLEAYVIVDGSWLPRIKRLQATGTVVTLHAYQKEEAPTA